MALIEKRRLLYPYYAGYSEAFVEAILDRVHAQPGGRVLDPWNGSGTTTDIAAKRGLISVGYDINPALVAVARARTANLKQVERVRALWQRSVSSIANNGAAAIDHCVVLHKKVLKKQNNARPLDMTERAVLLCALFYALRKHFAHARTKNPSWFSSRPAAPSTVKLSEIRDDATASLDALADSKLKSITVVKYKPIIHNCDFLRSRPAANSFDFAITSPPYLTRVDYVKSTLPELLLLHRLGGTDPMELRERMIGSPLVGPWAPSVRTQWGKTATRLICAVEAHPSKASATYYLRFFLKYFDGIERSLKIIGRALREGGSACLVVQTSYYKELFIDLPKVISEMCTNCGMSEVERINFETMRSMANVNSRATSAKEKIIESAVVLRKITGGTR